MLNTIANKVLPTQVPELITEESPLIESEVVQWQNKIKTYLDTLSAIQKECTGHATYWSAFFENQMQATKQNSSKQFAADYEKLLLKVKTDTDKSVFDFEKKIAGKLNNMKLYVESLQKKLLKKRHDQKIEIEKHQYYCHLYEAKQQKAQQAAQQGEDALQLTAKEKQELEKLQLKLAKANKELARIEQQIETTFPEAAKTYIDFVENLSDMIYYDLTEIHDRVHAKLNQYFASADQLASTQQLLDSWRHDLTIVKKQMTSSDIVNNSKSKCLLQEPISATPQQHNAMASLGITSSNGKVDRLHSDTKPVAKEQKLKTNSSGMRSLNLDPKKGLIRRAKTVSHRRTPSKTIDFKAVVASDSTLSPPLAAGPFATDPRYKRQSLRSFSALGLEPGDGQNSQSSFSSRPLSGNGPSLTSSPLLPPQNSSFTKEDDSFSFTSSMSSLNGGEENADTSELNTNTSPMATSPSMSPNRLNSLKRSSVMSSDSNANRYSVMSTNSDLNNRFSMLSFTSISNSNRASGIYTKRPHNNIPDPAAAGFSQQRSPNSSTIDLISHCPVTTKFKQIDYNLKKYSIVNKLMSTQLYLHYNDYYKQQVQEESDKFNYKKLLEKQQQHQPDRKPNYNKELVKAAEAFDGQDAGCLSFIKDETLVVLSKSQGKDKNDNEWWVGKSLDGRIGSFPSKLVTSV